MLLSLLSLAQFNEIQKFVSEKFYTVKGDHQLALQVNMLQTSNHAFSVTHEAEDMTVEFTWERFAEYILVQI